MKQNDEYGVCSKVNDSYIKEGICKEIQKKFLNDAALHDEFLRESLNQFCIMEKETDADWETFLVWLIIKLIKKNHQLKDELDISRVGNHGTERRM